MGNDEVRAGQATRVVITGVDISIRDMVHLIIVFCIASIPAALFLLFLSAVFGAMFGSCFRG